MDNAMISCPYYQGVGACSNGCWEEPRCIVNEPLDGWKWRDEQGRFASPPPDLKDKVAQKAEEKARRNEELLAAIRKDSGLRELTETEQRLSDAIQEKVEEIKGPSSVRSQIYYDAKGKSATCRYEISQGDGTTTVYNITAWLVGKEISVQVKKSYHWDEEFWNNQLSDRTGAVVINSAHYRVLPDNPAAVAAGGGGFGGRLFKIKFFDGTIVETRNLWYQGVVPPQMRHLLPDTAEFVK